MSVPEAQVCAEAFGVSVAGLTPLSAGSVNSNFRLETTDRGSLFLRVYEEQAAEGAAAELSLVTQLSALGVATARPLRRLDGGWVSEHRGKPVGLYEWLPGRVLCQASVGEAEARAVGVAIARVHTCTPKVDEVGEGRFGVDGVRARLARIQASGPRFDADTALIRERLGALDAAPRVELPAGLIHGDLYRDNVLWQGAQLSALLDFESASHGAFVYDVMVCLHFWCFTTHFELPLCRALLGGYESVRKLTPVERAAHRDQGALAALRFAATRITDFSLRTPPGQTPARDYRRLLARMEALDAGALAPVFESA